MEPATTRRLGILVVALLSIAALGAARGDWREVLRREASLLYVPGVEGAIVARLSPGERVEILETRSGWVRVRRRDGTQGWIAETALSATLDSASAPIVRTEPAPAPARPPISTPSGEARPPAAPATAAPAPTPPASPDQPSLETDERDLRPLPERLEEALALAAAMARERNEAVGRLADLQAENERVNAEFIRYVTARHEQALATQAQELDAACRRLLMAAEQEHAAARRKLAKASGWEAEFEKAVRESVRLEVEEFKARWQGEQRGLQQQGDRQLREQARRLALECEQAKLAAVNAALASLREEMEATSRLLVNQEELRCQLALELVLERLSAGADVESIRDAVRPPAPLASPVGVAPDATEEGVAEPAPPAATP